MLNERDIPVLSGGHSDAVPPDPIPNSEVKRISGDGSLGSPHARVAHCQAPIQRKGYPYGWPFFVVCDLVSVAFSSTFAVGERTFKRSARHITNLSFRAKSSCNI